MSIFPPDEGYGTLPSEKSHCNNGQTHESQLSERPRCNSAYTFGAAFLLLLLSIVALCSAFWQPRLPHNNYYSEIMTNGDLNGSRVSKLPSWDLLPWKLVVEHTKTGSEINEYYVGYLQICDDGNGKPFSYRAVLNAVSNPPCEKSDHSPLIRMVPGKHYKLILINNSKEPTNLHTHGLHISGVGSVDDITRSVDPGSCLVYHYHILSTADVGTFWYHSHRHPLASNQVAGGAYGMLIVDETEEQFQQYPLHLQRFFRNEVLLQYASILHKPSGLRTNRINGIEVNSSSSLELTLTKDQYYYFRISFVVISDPVNFVEFVPTDACEARVVAYDGVYRSKIPLEIPHHKHMLTTSSRVDLAVSCQRNADMYFHQGDINQDSRMVSIRTISNQMAGAEIQPSSPFWDPSLQNQWTPRRPYYMGDLLTLPSSVVNEGWNLTMGNIIVGGEKLVAINQHRWDPRVPIKSNEMNQLVEWTLWNTNTHPFHIHINRMQVVDGCGYRYEKGEYYDSIAAEHKKCKVRLKFADFAGRVIAHCHKLKHEDKGMMVWINITRGPGQGVQGVNQEDCLAV